MNFLQSTFRLLAAGVLAISGTTILLSSANAGSNTPKPPTVKPTGLPATPTNPTMPMTDTSGSEPQTSEIPKAETDCDAGATIQGSSASPSIASASETSVSSISSSGANAGSLTVEQPKKSASLSGVTDLPKLTGSTTTAETSKKPSAAKPCPSSTSKTGVTPTSELNAPSATPSGAR